MLYVCLGSLQTVHHLSTPCIAFSMVFLTEGLVIVYFFSNNFVPDASVSPTENG